MGSDFVPLPPPRHPRHRKETEVDNPVKTIGLPKIDREFLRRVAEKKKEFGGKSEVELEAILKERNIDSAEEWARQGPDVTAEAFVTFEMIEEEEKKRRPKPMTEGHKRGLLEGIAGAPGGGRRLGRR